MGRRLLFGLLSVTLALALASVPSAAAETLNVDVHSPTPRSTVVANPSVVVTGRATSGVPIQRVQLAIQRLDTRQWLQSDGSWGRWAWVNADVTGFGTTVNFQFAFVPPVDGQYGMFADARDTNGQRDTSRPWIPFTVASAAGGRDVTAPFLTVTAPERNGSIPANNAVITGTASDDQAVVRVRGAIQDLTSRRWIRRNGSLGAFQWHDATLAGAAAPELDWSLEGPSDAGSYGVLLQAIDGSGNTSTRTWRPFTVTAAPPSDVPDDYVWGVGMGSIDLYDASRNRMIPLEIRYPAKTGVEWWGVGPGPGAPFPLIVVGHGGNLGGESSANGHRYLVRAGYVVAAPTHLPGPTSEHAADVSFVIDVLHAGDIPASVMPSGIIDTTLPVGHTGISNGGFVGMQLLADCCSDPRIGAISPRLAMLTDFVLAPPGTAVLMINGTADETVPYAVALESYGLLHSPKALITVEGMEHNLSTSREVRVDATIGFFDYYILGEFDGLDRVAAAVAATPEATLLSHW